MVDLPITRRLQAVVGARYETTDLSIVPVQEEFGVVDVIEVQPSGDRAIVTVPQEAAAADIDEISVLPAIGLVWEVMDNMKIRASWSRTLARPTMREMAPVATEEFLFGDEFIGNPDLTLSEITNYDLRWEWFRRPGEVLAFSAFYKELVDPIEYISYAATNRSFIQPVNFESGKVLGFELEARTSLDVFWKKLEGFSVGVNATWLDSEVDVPAGEQRSLAAFGLDQPTRPLQGQPDLLVNANVTWERERWGTSAGLFYNRVGETLLTGAARGHEDGTPDVFQEPFTTVDLKVTQKIEDRWSVSFKAANLLEPDKRSVYRNPGGEEAVKAERETAARFSLSASWKW
jgi:TonB-dependent receptor